LGKTSKEVFIRVRFFVAGAAMESPRQTRLLLSCREAADALRISERTLYDLTARGKLHAVRIGKRKNYLLADIEAFVKQNEVRHA
jgi:excisionase family DNA binding protein